MILPRLKMSQPTSNGSAKVENGPAYLKWSCQGGNPDIADHPRMNTTKIRKIFTFYKGALRTMMKLHPGSDVIIL